MCHSHESKLIDARCDYFQDNNLSDSAEAWQRIHAQEHRCQYESLIYVHSGMKADRESHHNSLKYESQMT